MAKCSFCSDAMKKGTGKMYVKGDGTIFYFCTGKCEKNYNMGRAPKKLKWTKKQ